MPFDRTVNSTGLPGLDQVFMGLRAGDNLVWQVDSLDDYVAFVRPLCDWARGNGRRLVYFRFAKHQPLVADAYAEVHEVRADAGFEAFRLGPCDRRDRSGYFLAPRVPQTLTPTRSINLSCATWSVVTRADNE